MTGRGPGSNYAPAIIPCSGYFSVSSCSEVRDDFASSLSDIKSQIVPWVKRLELFLTGYTRLVYRVKSSVTNSLKCESVNTCEICLHWRLVCNLKVRNCSLTGFSFSINKKRLKRRSNYLVAELNPFAVPHYELQLVSFTVDK